jgi:hypothetical protein
MKIVLQNSVKFASIGSNLFDVYKMRKKRREQIKSNAMQIINYFHSQSVLIGFLVIFEFLTVNVSAQSRLSVQYGSIAAIGSHPAAGTSQSLIGFRWSNLIDDPYGFELGLMHSSAGWFIDTETYLNTDFKLGDASANALLVIGIPVGFMGDPFYIQGGDITFGPGLFISQPIGSVRIEFRGETLTNLLSGLRGSSGDKTLTNSKTGSSLVLSGKPFYLLLRLNGDVLIPLDRTTGLQIGLSYLNFHTWQMASADLGLEF